jgi:phospholipid/cholesterol/gamma-HCH transport system permease protein
MNIFSHFGSYVLMLKGMIAKPENAKVYWKEFMLQCNDIGIGSLGIVTIVSFFMGAVSAVQTSYQLVSPLIPLTTIAQIVRDTVILEFSPTLVCIVLAGVVGSRIASELGNMRVSEQIDALEIMGINTKTFLVMPKIAASLLMIPLLVTISMVLGILGGRIAGVSTGILSADTFDLGLMQNFKAFNVWFALIKGVTFAFLISSISAYFGYNVQGGALEIGRSSTKAVVVSCIMVLLSDYVLAQLLLSK